MNTGRIPYIQKLSLRVQLYFLFHLLYKYNRQDTESFGCKTKHSICPIPSLLNIINPHTAYYTTPLFVSSDTCSFNIWSPLHTLTLPNPESPIILLTPVKEDSHQNSKLKQTKHKQTSKKANKQNPTNLR